MFELTFMESRKPYAANEIIDLVYSLPQDYRFRGRLYKTMLLRTFSRYYRTIPWANIGVPISLPRGAGRAFKTWRRLHARLSLDGAGLTADGKPGGYADYPAWLRAEPARGLIERILLAPDGLLRTYDSSGRVDDLWAALQAGADNSRILGRYLTAELRLRQTFEGTFRPALGPVSLYRTAKAVVA